MNAARSDLQECKDICATDTVGRLMKDGWLVVMNLTLDGLGKTVIVGNRLCNDREEIRIHLKGTQRITEGEDSREILL